MSNKNFKPNEFGLAVEDSLEEAVELLRDLIAFPSTRGYEGPVSRHLAKVMAPLVDQAEPIPIPDSFQDDPEYRWRLQDFTYSATENLRLSLGSGQAGKRLLLNAHMDVVPPSRGQDHPWDAEVRDGIVLGRGACDDKGQIAVIYLVLKTLRALGLKPATRLVVDLVVEEENGGNGTLWMVRNPVPVEAAIVMEPTRMQVCPAVRGAVWFTLTLEGRAGHSGAAGSTKSALKLAVKAMELIEDYHDQLLAESRGHNRLFDAFENPMPVTFGQLEAGDWPATAPSRAVLRGVFGFLPNKRVADIQDGLHDVLANCGDPWLRDHFTLSFDMLNSDGNEIPEDHELVEGLGRALRDNDESVDLLALTASCDAFFYNNTLQIPTVVFGAGDLWKHAHSNDEQIAVSDIRRTEMVLLSFISEWCGLVKEEA